MPNMLSPSFSFVLSLLLLQKPGTLAAPRAQWNEGQYGHHTGGIVPSPTGTGTAPTGSAQASSSNSAPNSSPSPGGSTDGSGRRGLAYNSSSPSLDIFNGASDVGWGVDWSSTRGQLPSKYMFVPQLWSPAHNESWEADVHNAQASHLLSFNEPDIPSQANMPVASAVAPHVQWMNKHASDSVKIGSVSVSNGVSQDPNNPMGLDYLKQWLDQCKQAKPEPCVVDFISVHWYGCTNGCAAADDLAAFKQHITDALETANGLPLWITEFQHIGSESDQKSFLSQALTWLDEPAQSGVAKYAYFMVIDGFMTTGGSLNSVGTEYAS